MHCFKNVSISLLDGVSTQKYLGAFFPFNLKLTEVKSN